MCGRFVQSLTTDELSESLSALGYRLLIDTQAPSTPPSYNVAPSQMASVLVPQDGGLGLQPMQWGFPPFTPKGQRRSVSPINARGDRLLSSPMFAPALKTARCMVGVNGYYEWQASGSGKVPYYLSSKYGVLYLCGLYRTSGDGQSPRFAIVTTQAHPALSHIHDREPAVLTKETMELWLAGDDRYLDELDHILKAQDLQFWEVSKAVNSPYHNDASLIEPYANGLF